MWRTYALGKTVDEPFSNRLVRVTGDKCVEQSLDDVRRTMRGLL